MQIFTATITFGASGTQSLTDLATNNFKATRVHFEPANSNTHASYVGGPAWTGSGAGLIHQLQIPDSSNKIPLDAFDLVAHSAQNDIQFSEFKFSGTNGESIFATVFVA